MEEGGTTGEHDKAEKGKQSDQHNVRAPGYPWPSRLRRNHSPYCTVNSVDIPCMKWALPVTGSGKKQINA